MLARRISIAFVLQHLERLALRAGPYASSQDQDDEGGDRQSCASAEPLVHETLLLVSYTNW